MKMTPLPVGKRCTNAEIGRAVGELHLCHEDTKEKVEQVNGKVEKTYTELKEFRSDARKRETTRLAELGEMKGQLTGLSNQVQSMMRGFGLDTHAKQGGKEPGRLRLPKTRLDAWQMFQSVTGIVVVIKVIDVVGPAIWHAIVHLP